MLHGFGLLAMVTPSDQVNVYHYNAIGNTIAITNQTGTIINKYAYTPFGRLANEEETLSQPFKFVGKYGIMLEQNGLYYMRARYYDAETGRFISEDPIGFAGGDVNLYGYVQNNPVMFIDPEGLWTVQLGISWNGGRGKGGTAGTGIVFGYSRKNGIQYGTYDVVGTGAYIGSGHSLTGDITYSNNDNINDLDGGAGTFGGSANVYGVVSAGGEVNIPFDTGSKRSYTVSPGISAGTPEFHAFVTHTSVNEWSNNNGGCGT